MVQKGKRVPVRDVKARMGSRCSSTHS